MKFILFFQLVASLPTLGNYENLMKNAEMKILPDLSGSFSFPEIKPQSFSVPVFKPKTRVQSISRYSDPKLMTKAERDLAISRLDDDFTYSYSKGHFGIPSTTAARVKYFEKIAEERLKLLPYLQDYPDRFDKEIKFIRELLQ